MVWFYGMSYQFARGMVAQKSTLITILVDALKNYKLYLGKPVF